MAAPSLCEGWTRAHVVTHVARNADALCHLARWATTGVPTPMYASPEARDADIAEGARRPAAEQVADLVSSAARFAEIAPSLAGAAEEPQVEVRGGRTVPGRDLPTLRLREVVLHHVDLDLGYTLADADAGFVERTLRRAVATLADARRRRRCGSAATRATCGRSATGRRTSPAAGRPCCCGSPGAARTRSRPRGRCRLPPWG